MKRMVTIERTDVIRGLNGRDMEVTIKVTETMDINCANCRHVLLSMDKEPCNSCSGSALEFQKWEPKE